MEPRLQQNTEGHAFTLVSKTLDVARKMSILTEGQW